MRPHSSYIPTLDLRTARSALAKLYRRKLWRKLKVKLLPFIPDSLSKVFGEHIIKGQTQGLAQASVTD